MSPTVTLIVGPEKIEFSCHKIFLSFYSSCFDRDIFGPPQGKITDIMNFPACSKQRNGCIRHLAVFWETEPGIESKILMHTMGLWEEF
jgi:hypothetical protein